jgi:ribonuclease Z
VTRQPLWSELRPIVEANPAMTFVLTHFSLRHCDPEIVAFFDKQGLDNVVAWATLSVACRSRTSSH